MNGTSLAHPVRSPPRVREWAELSAVLEGELFTDTATRLCYATDASIYAQVPLAVVCPEHAGDCVAAVEFCQRHSLPLIPRAAGTSLAGQCVGSGLVLDVMRHMDVLLEVDAAAQRTRVQPGLVLQALNESLRPQGLCFPIDPSTADRCTLGGMAGNNAWGAHFPLNGSTRDHMLSMEAVLADGSRVRFGALSNEGLTAKRRLATREGTIYRTLFNLVDRHRDEILRCYPDPALVPNNMGYALDRLARGQPWVPDGPAFNLAPFLCGSEGTLAVTTELTLRLSPTPPQRVMVCGQFSTLGEALHTVPSTLDAAPAALELLDRRVLQAAANHLSSQRLGSWIEGNPEAVLLIELEDVEDQTAIERARLLTEQLAASGQGLAASILDPDQAAHAWALRRAGLGLLMGQPGLKKPVTLIEDCAVAPGEIPFFVEQIQALMNRHGVACVYYGSVGAGLIHLRPLLDLDARTDRARMIHLQSDVAELVARFGGSVSAKHGDGRLRAHLLKDFFGPTVYRLLREVKAVFDPGNLLNPGKILDAPPPDRNLRSVRLSAPLTDGFDWGDDKNLRGAAGRCNGAGVCLQRPGRGVMCPSYMATRDERHTTRGRANVLRHLLEASDPVMALGAEAVDEVLDLCLACKGCKTECPAGVDMARIKAEVLQYRHTLRGIPLRARLLGAKAQIK